MISGWWHCRQSQTEGGAGRRSRSQRFDGAGGQPRRRILARAERSVAAVRRVASRPTFMSAKLDKCSGFVGGFGVATMDFLAFPKDSRGPGQSRPWYGLDPWDAAGGARGRLIDSQRLTGPEPPSEDRRPAFYWRVTRRSG
jgi:hypothetical protein